VAHLCGVPRVALYAEIGSTMDAAHELAEHGAPSGTLVLTDRQTAGRGRYGRAWTSAPGTALTVTLIERPTDPRATLVLSLRLGLRAAPVLDRFAPHQVQLKWPNDLLLPEGKVGGVLVEARWRNQRLEWVAIGIGINVVSPEAPDAAGLSAGVHRLDLLGDLVPALRAGVAVPGGLTEEEIAAFATRDWARGRLAVTPAVGTVRGLSSAGALIIETTEGLVECVTGSLVLTGV
jgi:BirA family biotin operon repressor/biotin-[acetyl-CoA-carboxylase] ligase